MRPKAFLQTKNGLKSVKQFFFKNLYATGNFRYLGSYKENRLMSAAAETSNWEDPYTTGFGVVHTDQEREAIANAYRATLTCIKECAVVQGRVVDISNRDVIVNIGTKSDGLVPLNEFRDLPDLKIGDEVDVYIEAQEDAGGQLVLSPWVCITCHLCRLSFSCSEHRKDACSCAYI